jgi:hypothetical protein
MHSRKIVRCNIDIVSFSLSHHSDPQFTAQLAVGQRGEDVLYRFNWFSVDPHDHIA